MPELPEVQTVVATLAPRLAGRRIARIAHLRNDIVNPAGFPLVKHLTGRIVASVSRRGKRIVIALDSGESLFIHLGMSGRLTIESSTAPILPHTHLIAEIGGGRGGRGPRPGRGAQRARQGPPPPPPPPPPLPRPTRSAPARH